jgi:hypothetical protein
MNYVLVFCVGVVTVVGLAFVITGLAHFIGAEWTAIVLFGAILMGLMLAVIEYQTEER